MVVLELVLILQNLGIGHSSVGILGEFTVGSIITRDL